MVHHNQTCTIILQVHHLQTLACTQTYHLHTAAATNQDIIAQALTHQTVASATVTLTVLTIIAKVTIATALLA
jgi:hypothetical protein